MSLVSVAVVVVGSDVRVVTIVSWKNSPSKQCSCNARTPEWEELDQDVHQLQNLGQQQQQQYQEWESQV